MLSRAFGRFFVCRSSEKGLCRCQGRREYLASSGCYRCEVGYGFSNEPKDADLIAHGERTEFVDARTMAVGQVIAHEFAPAPHSVGRKAVGRENVSQRQFTDNGMGVDRGDMGCVGGLKRRRARNTAWQ